MRYVGSSTAIMIQSSGLLGAVALPLVLIVSIRYRKDSLFRSRPPVYMSCSGSSRFTVLLDRLPDRGAVVAELKQHWWPIIGLTRLPGSHL